MTRRFLLATRSAGKLRELNKIFAEFGLEVLDLSALAIAETPAEESLEAFDTFEENALAKARYFFDRSGGMPTFADDSGLCVDALDGEPGVYSKRWSGAGKGKETDVDIANNAKLVARMSAVDAWQTGRDSARYVSVAAYKDGSVEMIRRGEIEGRVVSTPRGAGGFGYDPYFEAPELGGTFAEATVEKTARASHRSRAFRALLLALRADGRL